MSRVRAFKRDLLGVDDLTPEQIVSILRRANELARGWNQRLVPRTLQGRRIALINDDSGWRNTSALELGAQAMGAVATHVPATLSGRESIADLAGYLGNWFELIAIRTPSLDRLCELADASETPVINLRTSTNHPCETLGDLAYIASRRGGVADLRVVVVAPDSNILGSWIEAAAALPLNVTQLYPERWHVRRETPARFSATTDKSVLRSADLVITDCWPKDAIPDELLPYQITSRLLDRLPDGARFIPCPPVTRGEEVSADAMSHRSCVVPQSKAWLLHVQNAVLEWSLRANLGLS